ncbi:hypothetical protein BJV74DRAFT_820273 [Russula compacta]|nr:hypothetical protein BJV74DRAFT_820273 [Russula compacta]
MFADKWETRGRWQFEEGRDGGERQPVVPFRNRRAQVARPPYSRDRCLASCSL